MKSIENSLIHQQELLKLQLKNFISTRQYATWKGLEKKQDSIKKWLNYKLRHLEGNRFIFEDYGIVCKYVRKKTRRIDHTGLAHELANYFNVANLVDLGCISFAPGEELHLDQLKEIQLPITTHARFTMNKQGKLFNHHSLEIEPDKMPELLEVPHELALFNARHLRIQQLQTSYSQILDSLNEIGQSFKCDYGTLSIINNKPQYDTVQALELLGQDMLLNHVKVDMDMLKQLIRLGIIDNFSNKFISVEDVRVDFIVQTLESEQKLNDYLEKKLERFMQRIG